MTNKEAIDILTGRKQYGSSEPEKMCIEFDEAFDLAIEALKERPTGDTISREALKKAFEKVYPLATNEMGGVVNKRIYDIIDNAPAVEPRIEYGTDGQPYRLFMSGGKEYERPQWSVSYLHPDSITKAMSGGQVVPDTLQGWQYEVRPQGRWITRTEDDGVNHRFYCSCCDREVLIITEYCPYCGAKMEVEHDS